MKILLEFIVKILYLLTPIFIIIAIYGFFCSVVIIVTFIKNKQHFDFVKGTYKKQGLLYKLFMIPYMLGYTIAHSDPNTFRPHGVVMFEGRQGCGKTSAMIKYATDLKQQYPLSKIVCNTEFKLSDVDLTSWEDMINVKNGTNGLICILDETQQWFNSKQSKDFPPECLS